jgi:hypothetical protein
VSADSLLQLIWLASPALPVGGFSYSEGLEAAVDTGRVSSESGASRWLLDQLQLGLARSDLPLIAQAHAAWLRGDAEAIREECLTSRNARTVWKIATKPYAGAHFATFPPEIPERCIKAGSREGDTVLDPFMGSGTTALVARNLQRRAIGCEINEDYIKIARQRLQQLTLLA